MLLRYVQLLLTAGMYVTAGDAVDYCPDGCRCPSITVANCSYGALAGIPAGEFDVLVQDLDFSHNRFTSLEEHTLEQVQIAGLINLNLSHNDIEYINMKAIREGWLKTLDLSWNRIQIFNSITIQFTPQLQRLSLAGNPRINLSETDGFLESKSLTHLNMSCSELGVIPDVTFGELPHLRHLDLSYNRLTRLRPEVFSKLSQLEWLDLSYNHLDSDQLDIISRHIGPKVTIITDPQRASPCTWPSDSLVNCSGNDITDLPEVGFTPTLKDVDLSYNKLTRLTKEAVDRLGNVTQFFIVNFSHNLIEHIDEDAFKEGLEWREVDLSWNRLMSINSNTFLRNNCLKKVSFAGNTQFIINPSGNFLTLGALLYLDLSHCGLTIIPDNTFSSVENLESLDLSHNNIAALQPEVLTELFQLNLLDVSYNRLETLEINTLSRLFNDKNINLDIKHRRKRDASTSIGLLIVGNPWLCDCKMLQVYEWCLGNQLTLPVICEKPQQLHQQLWEVLASVNCTNTTTTTHYHPSTESPIIVTAIFSKKQTMWLGIAGGVLLLSVVSCIIATVRDYMHIRKRRNINVRPRVLQQTHTANSSDQRDIEHTELDNNSHKPLLYEMTDSSEHHTTLPLTLSVPLPPYLKGVDDEQRLASNMEGCLV